MKVRAAHIWTEDARCWCAPDVYREEISITFEPYPGIVLGALREQVTYDHWPAMHRDRVGKLPLKPAWPWKTRALKQDKPK